MKDTYYFSHDYNTRTDVKIKRIIAKHGMIGYGVFWAIIEDLYNNANALPTDYESIAFDLRTNEMIVKSIVNDFDLFIIDGELFGSFSVQRRLDERNERSTKARESANKRWNKSEIDANALPLQSEPNAIKESKVKNKKKYKDMLMCNFETSDCSEDFLKAYTIAESFRKKFIQIIESKGGSIKELEEAKVEAWVNPIILLQKTDKVSIDKIREVYKEFGNLDFWAGVISSTSGVRKNFNKLVMAVDKLKPNQKAVSSEMTESDKRKLIRQQMGI